MATGQKDLIIQGVANKHEQDPGGADFQITNPEGRKGQAYGGVRNRYISTTGKGVERPTLLT